MMSWKLGTWKILEYILWKGIYSEWHLSHKLQVKYEDDILGRIKLFIFFICVALDSQGRPTKPGQHARLKDTLISEDRRVNKYEVQVLFLWESPSCEFLKCCSWWLLERNPILHMLCVYGLRLRSLTYFELSFVKVNECGCIPLLIQYAAILFDKHHFWRLCLYFLQCVFLDTLSNIKYL